MNNDELKEEYLLHITSIYDEYLMRTEKRGISYGELAYLQSLDIDSLQEIENEIFESLDNED